MSGLELTGAAAPGPAPFSGSTLQNLVNYLLK